MLLRIWKEKDWRKMIGVGQFTMIVGWVFLRMALLIHRGGTVPPILNGLASGAYWKGFCNGVGIATMLLSVILNTSGLVYYGRNCNRH